MRLILNPHTVPYYEDDLARVWQAASNQTQTNLFWGPDDSFNGYTFNWGNHLPLEVLYVGGSLHVSSDEYWHMVATLEDEDAPVVIFLFVRDEPPYNEDHSPVLGWRLAPRVVALSDEETRIWRRYPGGELPDNEVEQAAKDKSVLRRKVVALALSQEAR